MGFVYDAFGRASRRPPRYCKACGTATERSKDYCTEHLELNPYPKRLLPIVAEYEREVDLGRKGLASKLEASGHLAQEILAELTLGPKFTYGLLHRVGIVAGGCMNRIHERNLRPLLGKLERAGFVTIERHGEDALVFPNVRPGDVRKGVG